MNYYCYSIKKGLFDKEMEYAKSLGVYLYYDQDEDKFYDKNNLLVDIKDKLIFPRTGALQAKDLVEAIINHGGISLVNQDDYEKTLNWPYYLKTIRKNIVLSGSEILENPQYIINMFNSDTVFFKTKFKNFSQIIKTTEFLKNDSPFINALKEHLHEDFIISDAVSIVHDEYGPLEYRAFIVRGEIFNISRISDNLLCRIPTEILNKLQSIIASLKETEFSDSYVIDLFVYKNQTDETEIDVLECNPIIASGTYLYNSIFEKSKDLKHNCPSASIPTEKIQYDSGEEYSFNAINESTPSIYYNLPGGFAADLTSFSIFGTKSSGNMFFHFSGSGINFLGLSALKEDSLSSDEDILPEKEAQPKKLLRKKEENN